MASLLWLYVGLALLDAAWSIDPCTDANLLSDGHRSMGYEVKNYDFDSLICDRTLRRGWYRFSAVNSTNRMPETCPDMWHCGTHVPIWLRGPHPSPDNGVVSKIACGHTDDSCCGYQTTIKVRNCGTFYAYELRPTPGCPAAYCAGGRVPCSPDMWSPTGFEPGCTPYYPKMTQRPELSLPILRETTFVFRCHIPFDPSRNDVGFQVKWLFDGNQTATTPVTQVLGKLRNAELDQKHLKGHLGREVTCSAESYFLNATGRKSPPIPSNPYWAGIKLSTPRLTVGENEKPRTVQIISTIPIVCNNSLCRVEMYLEPNSKDVLQTTQCTQTLKPSDWDPVTHQAVTSFQVLAKRDYQIDGDKNLVMHFKPIVTTFSGPPVFNNTQIPSLQVMTKDRLTGMCDCWGDPHCKTLDQTRVKGPDYNYYKVGEFTMYNSTSRVFEVQTRTWHCGHVSCNCAVAAREGNDVITIDMCRGPYGMSFPKVRIQHQGQLSQGTIIHRNSYGTDFLIDFPSGAWVKAVAKGYYMNIFIHAPEDDFNATQGLCGTFNRRIADDQTDKQGIVHRWSSKPDSFVESWRVPHGTSMFDKEVPIDPKLNNDIYYCNCDQQKGIVDCRIDNRARRPAVNTRCAGCHVLATGKQPHGRRRRATPATLDTGLASYYYDYGLSWTPTESTFPTKSGITLTDAQHACNDSFFAEPIVQKCAKQIGVDVRSQLDSCVDDIKNMGSLDFIQSAVESIIMNCIETAITDPVYYDNSTGLPPAFLTTDRCPSQCSGRGACVQGTCHCKTGFSGDGCEIDKTKPPAIFLIETADAYIRTTDKCDLAVDQCGTITLIGENIEPSSTLQCRFEELKFDGTQFRPSGHTRTVDASYISIYSLSCSVDLPGITSFVSYGTFRAHEHAVVAYNVSVTNNGVSYSSYIPGYIVNSKCMSCQANGDNCTIKADACLIDGICYSRGRRKYESYYGHIGCAPDCNKVEWTVVSPGLYLPGNKAPPPPYPDAPIGGTTFARVDVWTKNQTGCPCTNNEKLNTCACCEDGGCPCSGSNAHQCTQCGDCTSCGKLLPSPDNGIDAYTLSFSSCQCVFDQSDYSCACCRDQVISCACGREHKNQCVYCAHMDTCGSKPWIFGPPIPITNVSHAGVIIG